MQVAYRGFFAVLLLLLAFVAIVGGLLVLAPVGVFTVATTAAVGFATAGTSEPAIAEVLSFAAAAGIDLVVFLASFRVLTAAPVTIRPAPG